MSNIKDSLIIAQITDLHIGFDGEGQVCQNSRSLRKVISELNNLIAKPDVVVLTGDLVESGEDWAYQKLREQLKRIQCPIYYALGNHDNRAAFLKNFPEIQQNEGYVQYVIEDLPIRIIILDTHGEGLHGGEFCEKRAAWLTRTLAKAPDRPTLIAMHHPPIKTGIAWMTTKENAPWVKRFRAAIKPHKNVVHIIAGHIHRTIFQQIANTTISVCEAVAPEVKLELAPIEIDTPDDRTLLLDSTPSYGLHHWDGSQLTSHFARASGARPIVKFDKAHAFVVRKTLDKPK